MAQADLEIMPRILRFCFIIACFLALTPDDAVYAQGGYVDTHIHVDPMALARKKGRFRGESGVSYGDMAENIIALMDEMRVSKAILVPPPQVPSQQGVKSTYETCVSVSVYYPDRLLLGAGGDSLNPLIYQYAADEVTPEVKALFRAQAERLVESGIVVFGEMAALHLSMQEHHIFSRVEPDHPLFLLLADIAAENNIPIDLHMEAVPEDIPTPESLLRMSSRNPSILKANISGFERLLEHNPKAKIVWQHIGWDNIGYMTPGLIRGLLERHPNLYLALRIENRQERVDQSGLMPNRIVDKDWNVYPEWKGLILDFSSRIVMGSDEFMGLTRRNSRPKDSFLETWGILEEFSKEIAFMIGRDNAIRIYRLE